MADHIHQEHKDGSFYALFYELFDKEKDRLNNTDYYLTKKIEKLEQAVTNLNAANVVMKAKIEALNQVVHDMKGTIRGVPKGKLEKKEEDKVMNDAILHLKEKFRSVATVKKSVLTSGGGYTTLNFRMYLTENIDRTFYSDALVTTRKICSLLDKAGLDSKIYRHDIVMPDGTTKNFAFHKIELKETV
jgi:hypothetical protein